VAGCGWLWLAVAGCGFEGEGMLAVAVALKASGLNPGLCISIKKAGQTQPPVTEAQLKTTHKFHRLVAAKLL
jgi:hypothetical protein